MTSIRIDMKEYSELMRFAFNQIANKDDWKAPVDCVVPVTLAATYAQAIRFMTATDVTAHEPYEDAETKHMVVRLTAPGYNAGPAGDH